MRFDLASLVGAATITTNATSKTNTKTKTTFVQRRPVARRHQHSELQINRTNQPACCCQLAAPSQRAMELECRKDNMLQTQTAHSHHHLQEHRTQQRLTRKIKIGRKMATNPMTKTQTSWVQLGLTQERLSVYCLAALILLAAVSIPSSAQKSTTTTKAATATTTTTRTGQPQQASMSTPNDLGVTQSYSEAIKWSFGGWAPLSQQQRAQMKNATASSSPSLPALRRNSAAQAPTSPVPQVPMQMQLMPLNGHTQTNGTRTAQNAGPRMARMELEQDKPLAVHRQDSLSESATSSQHNVHFAGPPERPAQPPPPPLNAQAPVQHSHNHHQQHPRQLQKGPAYAMQPQMNKPHVAQQSPPVGQFSVPAPVPIVREQLLPTTANQQHSRAGEQKHGPFRSGPHFVQPPVSAGMHMQPSMNQHYHQAPYQRMPPGAISGESSVRHPRRPHPHQLGQGPNNRHEQHMREMDRRHKQHMMQQHHRHQMMMMMQHQQQQQQLARQQQQHHQAMSMQQQQQQQQQQHHAPAIPFQRQPHDIIHPGQQLAVMPPPNLGTFKVIEGEQPIVFSGPQLPELEQQQQQRPREPAQPFKGNSTHPARPAHQMAPYSQSAMGAIEKDNLNYNQAMRQVSNSLAEEAQQQQKATTSNNIQDVKQRQINNDHQQQQQQQTSSSKSPYLTIPVAVETEGDKVLTPDDINEIEKHVINVLPNLKTADKLVKIADTQLDLEHIKSSVEQARKSAEQLPQQQQQQPVQHQQQQMTSSVGPAELHQMNYEEHRSTMRQLEGLGRPAQTTPAGNYRASATSDSGSSSSGPTSTTVSHHHQQQHNQASSGSQAASAPAAHHEAGPEHLGGYQLANENEADVEHQYYTAAGPAQELDQVDPDQMVDYNLIKNDLLQNIHYEPTRAQPTGSHAQNAQTASTPPMPAHHGQAQHHQQRQPHKNQQQHPSTAGPTRGAPTVTRYFHQGRPAATATTAAMGNVHAHAHTHHNRPDRNQLFGRLRPQQQQQTSADNNYQQHQQQQVTSTTRTILGGRKVSEVMRPLVHTTPVPMTSPMHVPSVEPEKVDAIQFIAGNDASDKQPIVVEAHQLVSHTPDGGIDYSSGGMQQQQQPQQQQPPPQQQQLQQLQQSANQTYQLVENQQQQQPQQQQQQQFYPQANPNEENQGAIIEYVSISDQALNNALAEQHQQQQQHPTTVSHQHGQQAYEISTTPEVQPAYMNEQQQQEQDQRNSPQPPLLYAYSTQQQQQQDHTNQPASTASYMGSTEAPPLLVVQQQQQQQRQPESPSLAWSPSIANEHQQQQQQLEMSGQVNPMQQLEFPATAGYNLFGQPQQQQQQQQEQQTNGPNVGYEQQQQEQQQQQEPDQDHHSRWRTKAGGRQPNPDAQYDGQIAKDTQNGDDDEQQHQQEQQQVLGAGEQSDKKGEHNQQQQLMMMIDDGQQQQQQQQQYATTNGYNGNQQRPAQAPGNHEEQQQSGTGGGEQQQHERVNYEQQPGAPVGDSYQQPGSTMDNGESRDGFGSTSAYVGGAQVNHQTPSGGGPRFTRPPQAYGQSTSASSEQPSSPYGYAKLDRDQQQQHLEQQRAQHQAQLAELMNQQQQQQQYQTTTPLSLTTASEQQQQQQQEIAAVQQRAEQEVRQEQQQQQEQPPSQQDNNNSNTATLLINPDAPIQTLPILDQQSLIHDHQDQTSHEALTSSNDDATGKLHHQGQQHQHQQQPATAAVYQVYQAYYAPKDHKPLPGYIRLSLDEFNELFKDAEIQFVDKNLNGLTANLVGGGGGHGSGASGPLDMSQQHDGQLVATGGASGNEQQMIDSGYDLRSQDHMRAAGSELQSIVVDRRSISSDRRSSNATTASDLLPMDAKLMAASDKKLRQLGQAAVKKIISIRNSRQAAAKQASLAGGQKISSTTTTTNGSKLVMKRVKSSVVPVTTIAAASSSSTAKPADGTGKSTQNSGDVSTTSPKSATSSTSTTTTTTTSATPTSTTAAAAGVPMRLPSKRSKVSQIMPKKKKLEESNDNNNNTKKQLAPTKV